MIQYFINAFTLQYLKFAHFKFAQNPTALDPGLALYTICVLHSAGQRVSSFSSSLCTWKYRLGASTFTNNQDATML